MQIQGLVSLYLIIGIAFLIPFVIGCMIGRYEVKSVWDAIQSILVVWLLWLPMLLWAQVRRSWKR